MIHLFIGQPGHSVSDADEPRARRRCELGCWPQSWYNLEGWTFPASGNKAEFLAGLGQEISTFLDFLVSSDSQAEITQIRGDLDELEEPNLENLLPLVYEELRRLASSYLHNERVGHTLQTTALVHEAYARLAKHHQATWNDRGHFFRVAAKTMRRILVNHAVSRKAAKRGGGKKPLSIDEVATELPEEDMDLVALDEALQRLSINDQRKSQVVELRFFAGCTAEETAEALGVSKKTVDREWRFARSWLKVALSDDSEPVG